MPPEYGVTGIFSLQLFYAAYWVLLLKINTYSFRIVTQSGVAKFDFFEIFYTQGPFRWKGWGKIFLLP